MAKDNVKVSFNLPQDEIESLRELARQRNITVTQALREAIANERFIGKQLAADNKILIDDGGNHLREVVFRR